MEILGATERIFCTLHNYTKWSFWKTAGTYPMSEVCFHCIFFLFPVGGSAVGGGVVPVSDYSYSSPYSQYTTSYGTYGYGAGGLLSK
jgi:hypothetical protein